MNICYSGDGFQSLHSQRGVNLIEIMVAMAIGLVLVLGATTLYVNTKKTSDVDDSIARLQETSRYAFSVIEADVRMANYFGLSKGGTAIDNKNSNTAVTPSAFTLANVTSITSGSQPCGATFASDVENYVDATNNNYTFGCGAFGASVSSADTLTIRRVESAIAAAADTTSGTRLQVCSTRSLTKVSRSTTATCPGGEFHNLVVNGYYVDQQSDQSSTYPSLRRKTLINGPAFQDIEIIPGIEDMQIELGWDDADFSSGDSAGAVRYVQPGAQPAGGRIVAVRVWLLVRAEQPDGSYKDTNTYSYAGRTGAAISNLSVSATGADNAAYAPNDNYRRLLVSRTFFIRNVLGS